MSSVPEPHASILDEQIAYYRARAGEYDRTVLGDSTEADNNSADQFHGDLGIARDLLLQQGPSGSTLELACGTGIWTAVLQSISEHVTAIDASPEMLEIVRAKLGSSNITYRQADLFNWWPDKQYDLVFFSFFLSHVPPDRLDSFLVAVAAAVAPNGKMIIIDQYAPTAADSQVAKGDIYAERPLLDGRTFTIVKVFYSLDLLREKLSRLGLHSEGQELGSSFFFLTARRNAV